MAAGDKAFWADLANAISPPIVRLVQTAAQTGLTSGSAFVLTYGSGSEDVDSHNMHDPTTNPSRITPTVAGWYEYIVTASFVTPTTHTQLLTGLRKNGANFPPLVVLRPDAASAAANSIQASGRVSVNGTTDYLEHVAQVNGTGTLATNVTAGFQSIFELKFERPL